MSERGKGNAALIAAVLGVLALGGLGGLAVTQHAAQAAESARLEPLAEAQRRQLHALEVIQRKDEEFTREVASLAGKMEALRRILPEALDVPSFMGRYAQLAGEHGVSIAGHQASELVDMPLQRAVIRLDLRGSPPAIDALRAGTFRAARLAHWKDGPPLAEGAEVELTVFARPPSGREPARRTCGLPASRVWLWPWTSRLAEPRREVERLCVEIGRHAELSRRLDALQVARDEFQELVAIIEKLKAEQAAAP